MLRGGNRTLALAALLLLLLGWGAFAAAQDPPGQPPPVNAAPAQAGKEFPSITTNMLDMIQALGIFAYPFAIATLTALWFIVERLVVLRRGRVIPKPFVQRFLKLIENGELSKEEALEVCEENGSCVAKVFAHGVRKWGKSSVEVEQAIIDGGERQVGELRKHIRIINGVATIGPLIGLLGTVWGMLESFHMIAKSGEMGRTSDLAHGIAMALVTTAVGLLIAIPALVAYMYLVGRVDALVMEMDDLAQRLVWSISAEGLAEQPARLKKLKDAAEPGQKRAV